MHLSRRLQVLVDEERFARLERRSEETGASIGEIVRRALDDALPPAPADVAAGARAILGAEPMPVGDWAEHKREMLDARGDAPA